MLGATEFGAFNFALGFVSLFGIVLDAGLNQIVVREFARDRENERFFSALFTLQIFLAVVTIALISFFSLYATPDPAVRWIMVVLSLYFAQMGFLNLLLSVFRARQLMRDEVYPRVFLSAAITGLALLALYSYKSVMAMSLGYVIGAALALVNVLIYFQAKAFSLRLSVDIATWKMFLGSSFSLALLGGLSGIIQNNLDQTMLGFFGKLTEAGWYASAFKLLMLPFMPLVFIVPSFFPALSVAQKESTEKLQSLWNRKVRLIICISLPLTFGGIQVSQQLISFFYPPEFEPAVLALKMLFVAMGLIYLHHCYYYVLVVSNLQRVVLFVVLAGILVGLLFNLILIPRFGLYGSACSSILTHGFILISLVICTARYTDIKPFPREVRREFTLAFASSLIMFLSLQWLDLPLIATVGIGVGIYSAGILGLGWLSDRLWSQR